MKQSARGLSRRQFLKNSAAAALGAAAAPAFIRDAFAAPPDRVTIYHSSVADNLNPYKHSSSPIYGQWQHVFEPLVEYNYKKKDYDGILAESWQFEGKRWVIKIAVRSSGVWTSVTSLKFEPWRLPLFSSFMRSIENATSLEVSEVQTPDDLTAI